MLTEFSTPERNVVRDRPSGRRRRLPAPRNVFSPARPDGLSYRAVLEKLLGRDPDSDSGAWYVVDTVGRMMYCNSAFSRLTGNTPGDLNGRLSIELYEPAETPVFMLRRQKAMRGIAVPPRLETRLRLPDGGVLEVELHVTSVWIDGRIAGRAASVTPIVDRSPGGANAH